MNRNDPHGDHLHQRRLQRLRARDRKWNHDKNAWWGGLSASSRWLYALDSDLHPAPGRQNREIDDGGLVS